MQRTISISYGEGKAAFTLDEGLLAAPPIAPRASGGGKTPAELAAAIAEALAAPDGRPRLREMARGRHVGIVVSDEFRAGLQKLIIEALLVEARAGAPARVTVMCATGTHEPAVYARNVEAWVREGAARAGLPVEFVANDCDRAEFVDLGASPMGSRIRVNRRLLETDLRVYGHESKHHYMAGYSSIDKQVIPGMSSRATVEDNHKRSLSPLSGPGRNPWHPDPARRDNPFSTDAMHIRAVTERFRLDAAGNPVEAPVETFALDMISNKDSIFAIAAGDPARLTPLMTAKADEEALFEVAPARYVVISPGGPPASTALYGVQNCFDMSLVGAIERGGEALVVAPCNGRDDLPPDVKGLAPDRKSKELFWDNLVRMRDWDLARAREEIERRFELYLWKTWRVLRLFKEEGVTVHLHSLLPAGTLAQGGFHAAPSVQAWVDERAARGDGRFNVVDQGNKLFVLGKKPA